MRRLLRILLSLKGFSASARRQTKRRRGAGVRLYCIGCLYVSDTPRAFSHTWVGTFQRVLALVARSFHRQESF